jgi:uncharacterized repeat protein (TIGR03803 family)
MTEYGGYSNSGAVFSMDSDGGNYAILHNFADPAVPNDGWRPLGSLCSDGTRLYGTTFYGGSEYYGTVFSLTPDGGNYTILHNFEGFATTPPDGMFPVAGLVSDGSTLYGMSYAGGKYGAYTYTGAFQYYNCGTIFALKPDGGDYTILHNFGDRYIDGAGPEGDLLLQGDVLYGMTTWSNTTIWSAAGILFSVKPDGSEYSIMHLFSSLPGDGMLPLAGLMSDGSTLYGTTSFGGRNYYGVVFSYTLPTPTPTPGLDVTVSSNGPRGGDVFTVDVTVQPINQPFDGWGVIITDRGEIFTFDLRDSSTLIPGARALVRGVRSLSTVYSRQLYRTVITLPGWIGSFDVIAGLVPAGEYPMGTQDAIPGYVDTEMVTVTP